jgi:hypothetical protein
VKCEVLAAVVTLSIAVVWAVTPCVLHVVTDVSEERWQQPTTSDYDITQTNASDTSKCRLVPHTVYITGLATRV